MSGSGRLPAPGAWARLRRDWRFPISVAVLLVVIGFAVAGPWIVSPEAGQPTPRQFASPCAEHLFGTDLNGRDLFARVLQGARISLSVGLAGALVSLVIGTAVGLIAGYYGGRVDAALMRIVDVLYSVPRLIVILVFINTFDPVMRRWLEQSWFAGLSGYSRVAILVLCLGLIEWLTMARIVRGQVLTLRESGFVLAAKALGQRPWRIILRHLLPNVAGVVLVYLTLTIPAVILDESFLSFLGLGVQPPQASWGSLLSDGAQAINPVRSYWWLLLFPAVSMSVTLLALNFLGDSLRDAFDPRGR